MQHIVYPLMSCHLKLMTSFSPGRLRLCGKMHHIYSHHPGFAPVSCVTLYNSRNLSVPLFPRLQDGNNNMPTTQGGWAEEDVLLCDILRAVPGTYAPYISSPFPSPSPPLPSCLLPLLFVGNFHPLSKDHTYV